MERYILALDTLLKGIIPEKIESVVSVTGLSLDSRSVNHGDLFFAIPGYAVDGRDYINKAIEKGAVTVLAEAEGLSDEFINHPHVIAIHDLKKIIGTIAHRFYGEPSKKLSVFAITGTNGKTTISQLLAKALTHNHKTCAVIGTLGSGFVDNLKRSVNTTPDAIALHRSVSDFLFQGANALALEISSHALVQHRAGCLDIDVAVFTNLSWDHLDYHQTIEEYGKAKRLLFDFPSIKKAIINIDDAFGKQLYVSVSGQYPTYAYSIEGNHGLNNDQIIYAHNIQLSDRGLQADVISPWGRGQLQTELLGDFNLSNCLAVLACLCCQEIAFDQAIKTIASLNAIPGRMQRVSATDRAEIVVDYSHTPDALSLALQCLRKHCQGKVWCVFGCGGDRDAGKRPEMGKIAEQYANQLIITNDNPRNESPDKIIEDILSGIKHTDAVMIEPDRRIAIQLAVQNASINDMVLIAGKGHEDYQIIGGETRYFSDLETVNAVI